jgi:hypothetical protein
MLEIWLAFVVLAGGFLWSWGSVQIFLVIFVVSGSRLHVKKWLVVGYGCCLCCGGLLMSLWIRIVSNLFFVVVDDKSLVCFEEEKECLVVYVIPIQDKNISFFG